MSVINEWAREDYFVITVFWSSEFIHGVVEPYVTLQTLDTKDCSVVTLNNLFVIIFEFIFAILLACVVDLKGHHLEISTAAMFLYSSTPLFGMIFPPSAVIRVMLMRWGLAMHFIVRAVRFDAIIKQPPDRNGDSTRMMTAGNETLLSLAELTLHLCLWYNGKDLPRFVDRLFWALFLMVILLVLIMHWVMKQFVIGKEIEEDTVVKTIKGIAKDPRGTQYIARSAQRAYGVVGLGLFLAIIVLFSTISVTDVIIKNTYKRENVQIEGTQNDEVVGPLVKVITIPLLGLIFSLLKGKYGRLAAGFLLSLIYVFNIISLILAITFLQELGSTSQRNKIVTTVQTFDKKFVDPTATGLYFDKTSNMPSYFAQVGGEKLRVNRTSPYYRPRILLTIQQPLEITVNMTIVVSRAAIGSRTLLVEPRKRYYFLCYEVDSFIYKFLYYLGDDIRLPENYGDDPTFRLLMKLPDPQPNCLGPGQLERTIISSKGEVLKVIPSSEYKLDGVITFTVPRHPNYTVLLQTCFGRSMFEATETVQINQSIVEVLVYFLAFPGVGLSSGLNILQSSFIMVRTESTIRTVQDSQVVAASFIVFRSLSLACLAVSFLAFYWTESFTRLCATTLATSYVLNEGLVLLTNGMFNVVQLADARAFLILNCIVGSLHVSLYFLYMLYYSKEDIPFGLSIGESSTAVGKKESEEQDNISVSSCKAPSKQGWDWFYQN